MTTDEHRLMILMFTRMYEAIGTISEALVRHGIWSADEKATLSQMLHADDGEMAVHLDQTISEYLKCAVETGVETGIKLEPPN